MTMTIESYYLHLLLTSNAICLAIACIALVRVELRCKRIEQLWQSPTDTAESESGDEKASEQVQATKRLERRLGELQRTVKVMDMKAPKQIPSIERNLPVGLPIENAVRMAKSGASIEDLTRNCGLNIGEARLMMKLHGSVPMVANGQ